MVSHSNILAWRIPWTEEPGWQQSMGSKRVDMTERLRHTQADTLHRIQECSIFISSLGCLEASVKQRWCKQYYCTFQRTIYYKIKKCLFFPRLFFMCHLCEKFYKPITVLYCIADCVSWVPRLTLLDLTNKLGLLPNALFVCRGLKLYLLLQTVTHLCHHSLENFFCQMSSLRTGLNQCLSPALEDLTG